jgi:xanthine dehydrogenase accessory factor
MTREIIGLLLEALSAGRNAALCRLLETRGSAPQKPGAAMLVYPDGTQFGTIGGGCVEAETKSLALRALASGRSRIAHFTLDHDEGWNQGLICGGRMLMAIEPISDDASQGYLQKLAKALDSRSPIVEAIVFDSQASGLPECAAFLFDEGGGLIAFRGIEADRPALEIPQTAFRPPAPNTRCWAAGGIAWLPATPKCRLVLVGAGHVAQAVAALASDLDFEVWVVDDREDFASDSRFPAASGRIVGAIDHVLKELDIDSDTYCVIVTRGHTHDREALYRLVGRGARYVGMIGSRRKIQLIFDHLISDGVPADWLSKVYAPLGVDIGSRTVAEIAISICAELVSHRNRGGAVPGKNDR